MSVLEQQLIALQRSINSVDQPISADAVVEVVVPPSPPPRPAPLFTKEQLDRIRNFRHVELRLESWRVNLKTDLAFGTRHFGSDRQDPPTGDFKNLPNANEVLAELATLLQWYRGHAQVVRSRPIRAGKAFNQDHESWLQQLAESRADLVRRELLQRGVPEDRLSVRVMEGEKMLTYIELEKLPQDEEALMQEVRKLFKGICVNVDRGISKKEWSKAFDLLDKDGSGNVTRKEWCAELSSYEMFDLVIKGGPGPPKKNFNRADWMKSFEMVDINKDGAVTLKEWISVSSRAPVAASEDEDEAFAAIFHKNVRGLMSEEEEDAEGGSPGISSLGSLAEEEDGELLASTPSSGARKSLSVSQSSEQLLSRMGASPRTRSGSPASGSTRRSRIGGTT